MIRWTEDGRYFKARDASFAGEVEIGRQEFEERLAYAEARGNREALPFEWSPGQPLPQAA